MLCLFCALMVRSIHIFALVKIDLTIVVELVQAICAFGQCFRQNVDVNT